MIGISDHYLLWIVHHYYWILDHYILCTVCYYYWILDHYLLCTGHYYYWILDVQNLITIRFLITTSYVQHIITIRFLITISYAQYIVILGYESRTGVCDLLLLQHFLNMCLNKVWVLFSYIMLVSKLQKVLDWAAKRYSFSSSVHHFSLTQKTLTAIGT